MKAGFSVFVVCLGVAGIWTGASFARPAPSNGISGPVQEAWTARYLGPGGGPDYARALAVDPEGNVYVTGGSFGYPIHYPEYATLKYDQNGNLLWVARYHDVAFAGDDAVALALDGKGSVYVTGTTCTQGHVIECTHRAYGTLKYDAEGNMVWSRRYFGDGEGFAQAMAIDADGNVYVTGGSSLVPDHPDFATIKYDTNGTEIWVARYSGPAHYWDVPSAVAVDAKGNVYVTGSSSDRHAPVYATVKYDRDGNGLWVARYNGPGNGYNAPSSLAIDGEGNTYVTGTSDWGMGFGYATIKYDPDGNELWVARYDPPANQWGGADAITLDAEGNVYVTGYSLAAAGPARTDYATIKYDSSGNQIWVARYHGPGTGGDFARRIALDSKGNVYVTGSSSGLGDYADFATIKYDPDGNELWVARSGSGRTRNYDAPTAFTVDGALNVYVVGKSANSADVDEYFTVKYSQ